MAAGVAFGGTSLCSARLIEGALIAVANAITSFFTERSMVSTIQTLVFLLAIIAAISVAADRLRISPSILLVSGGVILALVPGLPPIEIAPEIVLLVLLPPIIYWAAVSMSWREFRFNLLAPPRRRGRLLHVRLHVDAPNFKPISLMSAARASTRAGSASQANMKRPPPPIKV